MKRFLLRLEFLGDAHCGWASQDSLREKEPSHKSSVQSEVELALAKALHLDSQNQIFVKGCGRTDAGVTAEDYFAHFDWSQELPMVPEKLRHSLNGILPASIVITHLKEVPLDFDALENVRKKTYRYQVLFRRAKPTFERDRFWWFAVDPDSLDWKNFESCRELMRGTHDFKAFMAAHASAKTTVRTLESIFVEKKSVSQGLGLCVLIHFQGPGFLKHMVRNCTGFLVEALLGKKNKNDLSFLLGHTTPDVPSRISAGICAPASGLVLEKVDYE